MHFQHRNRGVSFVFFNDQVRCISSKAKVTLFPPGLMSASVQVLFFFCFASALAGQSATTHLQGPCSGRYHHELLLPMSHLVLLVCWYFCWSVPFGIAFLHSTLTVARHGLLGNVAAQWGCMGYSSRPGVRETLQRIELQFSCSQTPMCTHLVKNVVYHLSSCCSSHTQDAHMLHALVNVTLPMHPSLFT